MTKEDLLTAKKIAETIGLPVAKVTKYLKDNAVEADQTKGACKYYGPATIARLEKALKG